MHKVSEVKKWKAIEAQLRQASELLEHPEQFQLSEKDVTQYQTDLRKAELTEALVTLEHLGKNTGAKCGFWRRLKIAAKTLGAESKVHEYEQKFHQALATKKVHDMAR